MNKVSWQADELLAHRFPPPKWAIPGLIPEGITLLAGAPKVGKSWLSLGLAVAVATGGKALDSVEAEQGPVAYLALEDTGRRLQSRLRKVLGDVQPPADLMLTTFCEPLLAGGMERICAWLDDHPTARLLIVDVLARIRGTAAPGMSAYEVDYAAIANLKKIADTYQIAVIVVHHTRKAISEDFLDAVSGTQGLAGAADSILVLRRARGDHDAILSLTGRDVEETEHALRFDAETGSWQMLNGPADDYKLSENRRDVLAYLRRHLTGTPTEVSRALEIPIGTAKSLLFRMAKDDQVDTDGQGHYFAPATSATGATQIPVEGCTGCAGCTPDLGIA